MKKIKILSLILSFLILGCNDDDTNPGQLFLGDFKVYNLAPENSGSANAGTVKVTQNEDGSSTFTVVVSDIDGSAGSYVAVLRSGNIYDGGSATVITLNPVPAATGSSTTIVSSLDDGTPFTYNDFVNFDGYVEIVDVESVVDEVPIISSLMTDTGGSEFANNITYGLTNIIAETGDPVEGTVTFSERVNGEPFVTINLENTADGDTHPAHIHTGSVSDFGPVAIPLNDVDGSTGISQTSGDELVLDGGSVTYADLIDFAGYVVVHVGGGDPTPVLVGNIGSNGLTGESKTYNIESYAVDGIEGMVTFYQKNDSLTLVELKLKGSPVAGSHPAHIHTGSIAAFGDVVTPLNNADYTTSDSDGDVTAVSLTSIDTEYRDLLEYEGYIAVHESDGNLATIVGLSNIGINELSGTEVTYNIASPFLSNPAVTGTITFREKVVPVGEDEDNINNTVVTIRMQGAVPGEEHPAGLYAGAHTAGITPPAAAPALVADIETLMALNPVNGNVGISHTALPDLLYADAVNLAGFLAVETSDADNTIVAVSDFGGFEKGTENTGYALTEVGGSGETGTVIIHETVNGNTLVEITMANPAAFTAAFFNSDDEVAIDLNPVDATTGKSLTYLDENYVGLLSNDYYVGILSGTTLISSNQ